MIYDEFTDTYYNDRTHRYIDGETGVVIPSVTQILRILAPDKYSNVDPVVLANAAAYGNKIHAMAELIAKGAVTDAYGMVQTPEEYAAAEAARKLFKDNGVGSIVSAEKIVRNGNKYAGRYDLLTNDGTLLIDIKTTAKLDREALYWQLGMYAECLPERPQTAVLWLPRKGKALFERMDAATKEEVEALVLRYEIDIAE